MNFYKLLQGSHSYFPSEENVYMGDDIIRWASDVADYKGDNVEQAVELLEEKGEHFKIIRK